MRLLRTNIDAFVDKQFPRGTKVKTIILKIFLRKREKRLFQLIAPEDSVRTNYPDGYLFQQGWWEAWQNIWFTDSQGQPVPWLTYPAIDFLKSRLQSNWFILEYGGGSSTFFWATHCSSVVTIEHDKEWFYNLSKRIPDNVQLLQYDLEPISGYVSGLSESKKFHIIIIDGRMRNECCSAAPNYLLPEGVIILDDSQRERYQRGVKYVLDLGFKELTFSGLRSQAVVSTSTTIFYRPGNCLNI